MALISRGFTGRRRDKNDALPPGQYLTEDFPVLSAGPTPKVTPGTWQFSVRNEKDEVRTWNWDQFQALGAEDIHTDIHCVTRWSKLGTSWRGISLDKVFAEVDTSWEFVM